MKYIWKLRIAGQNTIYKDYDLCHIDSTSEFYTSVTKMRVEVQKNLKSGKISSILNYIKEEWDEKKESCRLINSGGEAVASFQKIEVK